MPLAATLTAATVWLVLGYRSHRAHLERRRLWWVEPVAEYAVALCACYGLLQLLLQALLV